MSTRYYIAAMSLAGFVGFMILVYIGLLMLADQSGTLAICLFVFDTFILFMMLRGRALWQSRTYPVAWDEPVAPAAPAYVPPSERPAFTIMVHDGKDFDVFSSNPAAP